MRRAFFQFVNKKNKHNVRAATLFKTLCKCCIFYIHLATRTPLIIVLYLIIFVGIFGEKTRVSDFCFPIFVFTLLLSFFLVLIFNYGKTKDLATQFVGKKFCDKFQRPL